MQHRTKASPPRHVSSTKVRWALLLFLSPLLVGFDSQERPEGGSWGGCSGDTSTSGSSSGSSSGAGCGGGDGGAGFSGSGAAPTVRRCAGGVLHLSSGGALIGIEECAFGCIDGQSRCNDCEIDDPSVRCIDDHLRSCTPEGRWSLVEECAGPCVEDRCLACPPNQIVCDGPTKQRCDASGEGFLADATEECRFGCSVFAGGCKPCSPQCDGDLLVNCDPDSGVELPPTLCESGCVDWADGASCRASQLECVDGVTSYPDELGEPASCSGCQSCGHSGVDLVLPTGCFSHDECSETLMSLVPLDEEPVCRTCDCAPYAHPLPVRLGPATSFGTIEGFACPDGVATYELVFEEERAATILVYNFFDSSRVQLFRSHSGAEAGSFDQPWAEPSGGLTASVLLDGAAGEVLTHQQVFEAGAYLLTVTGEFLLRIRTE